MASEPMTFNNGQIVRNMFLNIKNVRNSHNLTQREVALQLNMSSFSYSRIENGLVDVKLSRLEQIAAVFKMTVVQLLNWNNCHKIDPELQKLNERAEVCSAEISHLRRKIISLNEQLYQLNS